MFSVCVCVCVSVIIIIIIIIAFMFIEVWMMAFVMFYGHTFSVVARLVRDSMSLCSDCIRIGNDAMGIIHVCEYIHKLYSCS